MAGQLILAADQRARGIITIERYHEYLAALGAVIPACDGVVASAQPLGHLVASSTIAWDQRSYLSINQTGLAGSAFELDDRVVASLEAAAMAGYTGIKLLTRIDLSDRITARALEVLGRVLEDARRLRIEALIEPLSWSRGAIDRSTSAIVLACVVANDHGAPVLAVPTPVDGAPGEARQAEIVRVAESVGSPVLFVVGAGPEPADRASLLGEAADVMAGGGVGVVIGQAVFGDSDPAVMARLVADVVRHEHPLDQVLAQLHQSS